MTTSKILIKLIDRSLFPAIAIAASKIISLLLLARYLNLEYQLLGSSISFSNQEDLLKANSYSSLAVLAIIFLGIVWVISRASFFHDTHISPSLSLRLVSADLAELVGASSAIYQQMVVWLSYGWAITIFLVFQSYLGLVYSWLPLLALFVVSNATWLAVVDIEREL